MKTSTKPSLPVASIIGDHNSAAWGEGETPPPKLLFPALSKKSELKIAAPLAAEAELMASLVPQKEPLVPLPARAQSQCVLAVFVGSSLEIGLETQPLNPAGGFGLAVVDLKIWVVSENWLAAMVAASAVGQTVVVCAFVVSMPIKSISIAKN